MNTDIASTTRTPDTQATPIDYQKKIGSILVKAPYNEYSMKNFKAMLGTYQQIPLKTISFDNVPRTSISNIPKKMKKNKQDELESFIKLKLQQSKLMRKLEEETKKDKQDKTIMFDSEIES